MLSIQPVPGLPLFQAGDDLPGLIAGAMQRAGMQPQAGDIVVVAQKAVSKVEGRAVRLADVPVDDEDRALAARTGKPAALAALIRREASALLRVLPGLMIVRHRRGPVLANAGIDASNVAPPEGDETVLLWPQDPDASAQRLRAALQQRFGVVLAVIVSDSVGRAWRRGTLGTAIGVAGMQPLRDRRGERDLYGRVLQATETGVADEVAAAASLVIGEAAEGTPVALVRGAVYTADEHGRAADIVRPLHEDLFQ